MPDASPQPGPRIRWYWRLLLSMWATLSAGVMAALVLTILELYLTGHGYRSWNRMYIGPADRLLSVSDVIMLAGMLLSGLFVWFILRAVKKPL